MHPASVDKSFLTRQAAMCRRLAVGLPDEIVRQKLLALAAEYDAALALAFKQTQPGG